MIKDNYNAISLWFYSSYFRVLQKIHFREISVITDDVFPEGQSVLLLQNHFSLYDGYWSMYLCNKIFRRRFHVMMLEEELSKRMFLTRCGVFSVRKNSRDLIESIGYANELLQETGNVVTIYPSGEIISHHLQNFAFQRGFVRIAGNPQNHSIIALAVVLVDHFSLARPEIRIYLKNYSGERTAETIEKAYHSFYQSCISKQTE
ncbi:MAG TPA: lysophospholipid acyltransferase family protein [Prolixibacteraceae bacterium]|nr:lysophospholipid acyltransferase family protein [Prolixibacteraceae bacterium]